jgi:two-component system, cell cycle sensor histidine kinase and response regulator CckA
MTRQKERLVDDAEIFGEVTSQSDAVQRAAGKLARFGGWSIDVPSHERFWSDEMLEILAVERGETPSFDSVTDMFADEDIKLLREAIARCESDGTPFDQTRKVRDNTGRILDGRFIGVAERDSEGTIVRILGAFYDATTQSAADATQRRVEERLASTMKTISDGIIILDKDWLFTFVNPRAEAILKKKSAQLAGKSMCAAFPEVLGTEFAIGCRRALVEAKTIVTRGYYAPLDLWLESTSYPLEDGLAIYFRDVSEQETSKQTIADGEKQLLAQATLLDVARDAIVLQKMDHTIEYWNRAAADLYGWTAEEAMGKSTLELINVDSELHAEATVATIRDGYWRGELEHRDREGNRLIADCSWTLVRGDDGTPESILAVNADVTEKKRIEQLNLRTQRMESLGTLAGGVAHDLNNVLTPILMSVQLLASQETDPGRTELLETMEASVKRGAEMIRQVLSFARGVEGRRIDIDLGRLLDNLFAFCKDSLPANVSVSPDNDDDLWHTIGDPTQLLQVMTNLVNNAKDVLPNGGNIAIRAHNVVVEDQFSSLSRGLVEPGSYVVIEVEDNGPGMSPEVLDRVFEPFFTTKGVGEGTGLGLATSIAIVRSHGGQLHAYSEMEHGSRFHIHLPAVFVAPGTDSPPVADDILEDMPRGNGELVLVVDDEVAIRHVTCRTLEAYGYTTVVAGNGAEAISFIESEGLPIDLMLTDMMMPIMDGATAAAKLHISHSAIPIVAMSGLIANSATSTSEESGVSAFLPKPFTTGQLLRAIRGAIDSKARTSP